MAVEPAPDVLSSGPEPMPRRPSGRFDWPRLPGPRTAWWLAPVLVAALVAGLLLSGSANRPASRVASLGTLRRLPGLLIGTAANGSLVATDPAGSHQLTLEVPEGVGQVWLSPDGRRLVTGSGWALRTAQLTRPAANLVPTRDRRLFTLADQPWADHGRALVLLGGPVPAREATVAVESLRSRRLVLLGSAGAAVADPAGVDVVAAVVDHSVVLPDPLDVAVLRLDRWTPGRAPQVVITAVRFAQLLGLPVAAPYALAGLFSPDGRRLAVLGVDLANGDYSGVLVLSRADRVVGTFASRGSGRLADAAWSPDGARLALVMGCCSNSDALGAAPAGKARVLAWRPGASRWAGMRLPGGVQEGCLWAPAGPWLLCATANAYSLVNVRTRSVTRDPAWDGAAVLAWIPTPLDWLDESRGDPDRASDRSGEQSGADPR